MATVIGSKRNKVIVLDTATIGTLNITGSIPGYASEAYVGTQISNLVDSSPAALNTLNELAAALGDDPNFATTITNSIGTKWTQNNTQIANWNTAYGWGNHASAGYLTSYTDTNTTYSAGTGISLSGTTFNLTDTNAKLNLSGGTLTGALEITGNGDLLNLRAPVNGNIVRMTFSSNVPDTQVGHIQYTHGNTASYGSGEAFYIGGTESTTTILADGKLMFKEGIYSKPATGTGAGTRKDSNWDTAYGWGNHASAGYTSNVGDITGVTAGTGLTGGGTSGTVTLNVIGGSGITANANDIAVDSTVFRSTGGTMTGNLTMGANHIFMTNSNIYGVNSISINDPGEGIVFQGTTNITLAAIDDATDSIMNFSNASQLQINGQRAFADNYHPNADKWTTARTNTVTLTGDVTGSGNASVDGTGNWTVSIPAVVANNSHSHSNYLPLAGGTLTGATTINAGLSINRSSTSGALWFGTQNDKNHVLWNAYYGTDPVTRGNANTGFDGIYWNAYRGIHIRGGTHGANNIIVAENSSGSANDHTVKLYASNVKRFETTTTGAVIESTLLLGSYSDSAKQGKLILGGNSANKQAEIKCTNGNLHIDSENTSATYLNYYEGTAGVAFGTGAGGVAAWMGPDGDLWKSSSDNTGSRYFNDGYHPNADKWTTARTLTLNGDVTGSVSWDGSGNATLTTAVGNNSHSHTNYLPLAGGRMTGVFNLDDQKIQFGSGSNSGSTFGNNHYSMGVDIANGGWSGSNYSDLIIGYHTGVRIGGGYSGVRFYNNSPTTDTNNTGNGNGGEALLMTIGGGGSTTSGANVTINNDLYMGDNIHINAGKGFDNSGGWTRNQTPHGYIEFGPANASHAHIYTDRPNFYFNKDLYVNNQRVFHVGYHPNADKWTTARTNTVTLTGDVTGSGNASVDGTGNWTVSIPAVVANNSHSHSNYLTSNAADTATGKITFNAGFDGNSIFLNGAQNFDALKTSGFYSLYNATATGHTNAPFQYGAMISANNTAASGGMGMQLAHERTGAGTFIRGMNDSSDTWYAWQRIFMDNYHPNADKWTTLRTLFLTGDVTGSVNWDGSGNATMTTAVGNDSHTHAFNNLTSKTGGTGTYQTSGSFRAPIFYDSNNTGYYVDPASTSRLNDLELIAADSHLKIGGTGYVTATSTSKPGIELGNGQAYPHLTLFSSGTNTNHGGVISFRSALTSGFRRWNIGTANYNPNVIGIGVYDNNDNPHYGLTSVGPSKWTLDNSGNSVATGSHRAPIFYDSNDTNYYVDPASTGTSLRVKGDIVADGNYGKGLVGLYASTRLQNVFSMGTAFRLAADGTTSGNLYGMAWSHPNAGSIGGANNLNDHGLLIINNGVFKAAISSRAVFSADVRGTLFYDYNNTNYYVDPADTSVLNTVQSNKVVHYNGTSSNVENYLSGSGNSGTKLYWKTDSDVYLMNVDLVSGHFTAEGRVYIDGSTTNFLSGGPYSASNMSINFGGGCYLYSGSTNLAYFTTTSIKFNRKAIVAGGTTQTASTPNIQSIAQSSFNGVTQYHINFCNSGQTVHGRITSNNFSTTYATTSDYRVKEDVREMESATERLLQLNPVNFKWKGSEIRTDGFLAHEVDAIVPEAVVGVKDATEEVTDDEGVTTTVDSLQALDQAKLVPLLIKTIQELEARIAALENA